MSLPYQLVLPYLGGAGLMTFARTSREMHRLVFKQHKWEVLKISITYRDDFEGLAAFMRVASLDALVEVQLTVFSAIREYKVGLPVKQVPSVKALELGLRPCQKSFEVSCLLEDLYRLFPGVTSFSFSCFPLRGLIGTGFRPLTFSQLLPCASPWALSAFSICIPEESESEAMIDSLLANSERILELTVSFSNCPGPAYLWSVQKLKVGLMINPSKACKLYFSFTR